MAISIHNYNYTLILNFTGTLKNVLWKIKKNFKNLLEHETHAISMYSWVMCQGCLLIYVWVPPKLISITFSLFTWFHSEGMNSFSSFCLWLRKLNSNRLQSRKRLPSLRAASNCWTPMCLRGESMSLIRKTCKEKEAVSSQLMGKIAFFVKFFRATRHILLHFY